MIEWYHSRRSAVNCAEHECKLRKGGPPAGTPSGVGGIGGSGIDKIRDIINTVLKMSSLSECLNKIFGPGTILTNSNLPYLNASKSGAQISLETGGQTAFGTVEQPPVLTGRPTVDVASEIVNNPLIPQLAQRIYVHEIGNALAYQLFTNRNIPDRPFAGPLGGPPTADQVWQGQQKLGDPDIGRELEKCVFGSSLSGASR